MSFTNLWGGSFTPFQTAGNWLGNKINEGNEYLANQQNQQVDYTGPQDVDYTGSNPSWATQNQTIGQTNLTEDEVNSPDSLMEAATNKSEFDNSNNVDSDGTVNETSDDTVNQDVLDVNQKITNSNKPFRNLFQKMKQGMDKFDKDNIGSAKWDENEFVVDQKTGERVVDEHGNPIINKNFGKMTDKGKGLFGKEGGFMSKFGTGKGALSGLFSGLGGGGGTGGGLTAPDEYMYKNPWEGVQ